MLAQPMDRTKRIGRVKTVKLTADIGARKRQIADAIERRAYEIFEARGRVSGREIDDWLQAESEILSPVQLDTQEVDNALIVKGELPGCGPDEIEVKVERQTLIIAGQKKQARTSREATSPPSQSARRILRSLDLPFAVLTEKVTACFREGVLEVILPKATQKPEAKSMAATG